MAFLTIEQRGGKRGHGREAAGTKAAQEEGIAGRYVTARGCRWPRWCSLSVPFTTLHRVVASGSTRVSRSA
jgi:hypothetical protein